MIRNRVCVDESRSWIYDKKEGDNTMNIIMNEYNNVTRISKWLIIKW